MVMCICNTSSWLINKTSNVNGILNFIIDSQFIHPCSICRLFNYEEEDFHNMLFKTLVTPFKSVVIVSLQNVYESLIENFNSLSSSSVPNFTCWIQLWEQYSGAHSSKTSFKFLCILIVVTHAKYKYIHEDYHNSHNVSNDTIFSFFHKRRWVCFI